MSVLAGPLATGFGTPDAEPILRWLSLSMALNGLGVIPGAAMQREFRQGQQYVVDFANLLVSSGVTVALAMGGAGAMSLVWARLSSQCVSLALQYYFSRSRFAFAWDMRRFREIAHFGLPLAGANFLSWVLLSVGTVVVGREAGPVALGLYALAFNLSSWPTNAIGQSVRVVALPAFAQRRDAPPERTFLPAAAITWATALPVGLLLGVTASPLVTFLYGRTWAPAASPSRASPASAHCASCSTSRSPSSWPGGARGRSWLSRSSGWSPSARRVSTREAAGRAVAWAGLMLWSRWYSSFRHTSSCSPATACGPGSCDVSHRPLRQRCPPP